MIVSLLATIQASAAIITEPGSLSQGDSYRLAFVTSGSIRATSTDIDTYNQFVVSSADAVPELASLGTTWTAIVSTPFTGLPPFVSDARDHTETNPISDGTGVPVFVLNGSMVAIDNAGLWGGSVLARLDTDELGNENIVSRVWTGSMRDGRSEFPVGFAYNAVSAGRTTRTNFGWVESSTELLSDREYPVYGLSGVLTATAVPEPSSLAILGIGAIGLIGFHRRKLKRAAS